VDDKARLRAEVRAARRAWADSAGAADRAGRAELLARSAMAEPAVARACADGRAVTCYVSLPAEPPTDRLLEALVEAGADVLLPVIGAHRALAWGRYEGRALLRPAVLGILEPAPLPETLRDLRPAVLLVPALAVDRSGTRLGQGGGYYDTLLASVRTWPEPPAVLAVVGPDEVMPAGALPVAAHDQPVDGWVTG